jgi:hypothetical protein
MFLLPLFIQHYFLSWNYNILYFVFQGVHGSGYFELQILSIVNHHGMLSNGQCCGGAGAALQRAGVGSGACPRECTTYFSVCLKEYQSNVTSTGACSFGRKESPLLGGNSFTLPDPAKAQANIVLPFTFRWTVSTKCHSIYTHITIYKHTYTMSLPYTQRQIIIPLDCQIIVETMPEIFIYESCWHMRYVYVFIFGSRYIFIT